MDARLTDLELRYMALGRTLEDLSDVVAAQARELDAMQRELLRVRARLLDMPDEAANERPPHY